MKKLEARLTLLFTTFLSVLMLVALCVTYIIAFNQYKANSKAVFDDAFSQISNTLINNGSISDQWLSKQEATSLSVIYIEDNGSPILFSGSWQPQTSRDVLIASAKLMAEKRGIIFSQNSIGQTSYFTLEGDNHDTYNAVASVIKKGGKYIGVLMLQDNNKITSHGFNLAWQYLGIWLCATIVLCIVCRALVHIAVRPAAQAAQRQTEFVAAASHELRSPLTVISASIEAAQKSKAEAQGFLQAAKDESGRMAVLVDDLLLLASGDAKAWQADMQNIQPDSLCIELYDKYHKLAITNHHKLTISLPPCVLPMVKGDKARLLQLFAILIDNAMEYTAPNTLIEIIAKQQHNKVVIEIADHGKGIPPEEQDKIFTRFYRADKSRTDKQHFGLGLSVAQQIAQAHGAQLALLNTAGGGATFAIELETV